MSTYNTGNPVPSIDPRDLDDNATILDNLMNGTDLEYPDRLGVPRQSIAGMEAEVAAFSSPNVVALSGLTGVADRLPYFTGAGALSLTTLTAAARTVLDDTTVAAMLATMGGAPLASPALTGVPVAPTAALGTNTTQLATMAAIIASMFGTVSQSGGVPTGAGMEYSTGAGGDCFRFANGLQVSLISATVGGTTFSAGPLFTSTAVAIGAFTKNFIATPRIFHFGNAPTNGGWAAYYASPTPKSASNWGSWAVYSHVTSATAALLELVAIGRWY